MSDPRYNPEAARSAQSDLSLAARRRALAYIDSVWPEDKQVCPICGTNDWGINDVANLPVRPEGVEVLLDTTKVYPLVPVTCKKCGYTFFINGKWVLAGGTPPDLDADPSES